MSLTLILTRHAKSDWADPVQADRDRTLNTRGRRDAPRIGAWLNDQGFVPGEALVSAATRTRETWALLSAAFDPEPPVRFIDRLYDAGAPTILNTLREAEAQTVIVIGHNPGIGQAAQRLVNAPPDHDRFRDYPTCATLVCQFETEKWRNVNWGMGRVMAFVIPRDLQD